MRSQDLYARCDNLTPRKLDYWCQQGLFPGSQEAHHRRREFTVQDLHVAQIVSKVACAFDTWSGGRGAYVGLYLEIADQVRDGATDIHVSLGPGIEIVIDSADLDLEVGDDAAYA